MKNIRVYIAGPYTKPDPLSNTSVALHAANWLLQKGYVPFVPHLTLIWDFFSPKTCWEWLDYDNHWLPLCHVVLRLPGESSGADEEVKLAEKLGIPVFHTVHELERQHPCE